MTRRERHRVQVTRVPRRYDLAAAGGLRPDLVDQLGDLVDAAAVRGFPVTPLLAIDGTKFTRFIGTLIPDTYALLLQPFHIGVAAQEP